jgi:hypothetical protein
MPTLTAAIATDNLRCTCCGSAADVVDEEHGALCQECLCQLIEIQEYLDAVELE